VAEALKDVFALRLNINDDDTSRTGAFNEGISDAIESSTNATPIEVTMTAHAFVTGDEVFIAGHTTNTQANGVWTVTKTGANTLTLDGSVGNGVGGATGTVYKEAPKWVPILEDGFQVGEKVRRVDANTQHKDRGPRYSWPGHRNRDAQQIRTLVYPENAKFLLNMPIAVQSGTYIPKYHAAEEYFDVTLGTGTANFLPSGGGATVQTGRGALGLIAGGWSMSFDRESEDAIEVQLDCFINQETNITSAFPSIPSSVGSAYLGWPAQNPYRAKNTYIDFEFALADGTFTTGWTGDRLALTSATLSFSQTPEVTGNVSSSTPSLAGTWNQVRSGKPACEFSASLVLDNSDYLRITSLVALRKGRVRFMSVGDNPSGSTTSATNLAVGGTSVVVASNSGFHVGDCIILEQPTANKQQVVQITAIAGTTFTTTAAVVAMDGSGGGEDMTVRNTAMQVMVHSMDLADRTPPGASGNVKAVTISGSARLTPTTTTLVTLTAYNDDNAGYPSA
jgi:hypothetical protein